MRVLEWGLTQYNWCLIRIGKNTRTCAKRKGLVSTKQEDSHLQVKGRDLRRLKLPVFL